VSLNRITLGAGPELYAFICIGDYPFLYGSIGRRHLKKFGFPLEIPIDFALVAPKICPWGAKPRWSYRSHFLSNCDETFLHRVFWGQETHLKQYLVNSRTTVYMIAAPNRFRRNQIISDMRHRQVDRAHLSQSHVTVHRLFGVLHPVTGTRQSYSS